MCCYEKTALYNLKQVRVEVQLQGDFFDFFSCVFLPVAFEAGVFFAFLAVLLDLGSFEAGLFLPFLASLVFDFPSLAALIFSAFSRFSPSLSDLSASPMWIISRLRRCSSSFSIFSRVLWFLIRLRRYLLLTSMCSRPLSNSWRIRVLLSSYFLVILSILLETSFRRPPPLCSVAFAEDLEVDFTAFDLAFLVICFDFLPQDLFDCFGLCWIVLRWTLLKVFFRLTKLLSGLGLAILFVVNTKYFVLKVRALCSMQICFCKSVWKIDWFPSKKKMSILYHNGYWYNGQ